MKSIYGNMFESLQYMNEKYIVNEKDILYNKDKFDSGEINLCFVTGLSGSGKSTLAHNTEDNNENVEAYELDDVVQNYNYSYDNLKEYGNLIYSFFKGSGKQYKLNSKDDVYNTEDGEKYCENVVKAFIKYAMQYTKSHNKTKYIIEGVYLFLYFDPDKFKDYAVYIKGTSMLTSRIRAIKRDSKHPIKNFFTKFNTWKYYILDEKSINKWRDYYKRLI